MKLLTLLLIAAVVYLWKELQAVKRDALRVRYLEQELKRALEQASADLALTRQHLASLAGGATPSRESILHGLPYANLSPAEALALVASTPDLVVLDVRTTDEYQAGHIAKALHLPVNELPAKAAKLLPDTSKAYLVYCASGARSAAACEMLHQLGYSRVYHLAAGLPGWTGGRE